MKKCSLLPLLLIPCLSWAAEIPHEIGEHYPSMLLKDGTTLRDAEVIGFALVIRHENGTTLVPVGGFRPGSLSPVEAFFSKDILNPPEALEESQEKSRKPAPGSGEVRGAWDGLEFRKPSNAIYRRLKEMDAVSRIDGGALQMRADVSYGGTDYYLYPDINMNGLYRVRLRGQYYDLYDPENNLGDEWLNLRNLLSEQFGPPDESRSLDAILPALEEGINQTDLWITDTHQVRLCISKVEDRVYTIAYIQQATP